MFRHGLVVLMLLIFAVLSGTASAHGTGQHVLGTVVAIDATHMEVKTPKGATVSVKLTKETRFKEKGKTKSAELPVVGDRVVIEAVKDNKILTATEVHFSTGKKAAAPATSAGVSPTPAP